MKRHQGIIFTMGLLSSLILGTPCLAENVGPGPAINTGAEQGEVREVFPMQIPPADQCLGGGANFNSPVFNLDLSYSDFKQEFVKCQKIENPEVRGQIYNQKRFNVHELIDQYLQNPGCEDVKKIFERFVNTLEDYEGHFENLDETRMELLENGKISKDPQTYGAFRGWTSSMCGASHLIERASVYWYLLERLEERVAAGPMTEVVENGQVIQDCRNVRAWGNADLNNFTISLQEATSNNMELNYNTFGVPDQVKFYATNDLKHDSTCVGTEIMVTEQFNIDRLVHNQVKIEINASCEEPEDGTAWILTFFCSGAPVPDPCGENLTPIIQALREFLDQTEPLLNYYWMYALCFETVHSSIMPTIEDQFNVSGLSNQSSSIPSFMYDDEKDVLNTRFKKVASSSNVVPGAGNINKPNYSPHSGSGSGNFGKSASLNSNNLGKGVKGKNISRIVKAGDIVDGEGDVEDVNDNQKKPDSPKLKEKLKGLSKGLIAQDKNKSKIKNDKGKMSSPPDTKDLLANLDLMNKKISQASPVNEHLQAKRRQLDNFGVDLERFNKKNSDFCESQWKNGDELFQKISYTYCTIGILRLFGKGEIYDKGI